MNSVCRYRKARRARNASNAPSSGRAVWISISHQRLLGSGLIDHSQKMTVAAMAMADMKVCAQRS
jgi:hypothetical protein